MKKVNIAIDGPAGAGKSTIAKAIARQLGISYLDTGAMYRAVALKALRTGVNTADRDALAEMVKDIDINIIYINCEQFVYLDGENVSGSIRTPEVSKGSSDVAAIPEVRIRLVEMQRKIAEKNSVIMDGRDIGTYVLPDADLKVFLTASVEERARRRYNELVEKGNHEIDFEEVKRDMEYRDKNDSTRDFAPLRKADDAVILDTTGLSIDEVVADILLLVKGIQK